MEIVEAFSVKERGVMQGLTDFRDWLEAAVDPIDEKRLARLSANGNVTTLSSVERFSIKHRNARLRWTVKSTFPEKDIIKVCVHCIQCQKRVDFERGGDISLTHSLSVVVSSFIV